MHRFYLPPEHTTSPELTLTGPEAHHALHVLRIKPGEQVTVLDGCGSQILCEVRRVNHESLTLKVLERSKVSPPRYRITLAQAMPKTKAFETIVQKATELGVWRIVPVVSARTTPHFEPSALSAKLAKWQRLVAEAIKQSGNPYLPQIEQPIRVQAFLARAEQFDLALVAALQGETRHMHTLFAAYREKHRTQPHSVCAWIGPEGDFTPSELEAIKASGAAPISLGPYVLRVETAAICCLAMLNYELSAPD